MRKLAAAALSFSAAVFMSSYMIPSNLLPYFAAGAAVVSLGALLVAKPARLRLLLIFLSSAAAFLWNTVYLSLFYEPAKLLDGKTETMTAFVANNPIATEYGYKVIVRLVGDVPVKTQLYVYDNAPEDILPGYTVTFTARFRSAETIYGEKTDSFLSKGIYLLAYAEGKPSVVSSAVPVRYWPAHTAYAVSEMTARIFPGDVVGFMRALILGDTTGIYSDKSLSAPLSATGTSHIVSVSGMNIAFLMSILRLFIKKKKALAIVGIPILFVFMAVVGFMPPVTRAGIMQFFLLLAPLFKRESDDITSLSAALMLILLFNPPAASSAGLQLSFAAMLGIIMFTERIYNAFDEPLQKKLIYRHRIPKKLARLILASLASTIGALIFTVPLTALHFGTVSLIAPLVNLFITIPVTLAFCAGVAAVALGLVFTPLGTIIAFLAAIPVRFFTGIITFFARVPSASVYTSNPAIVIWLVYVYLIFVAVFALRAKLRQLIVPACLSVVMLCLFLVVITLTSLGRRLTVTALDVGQGQSVVLTCGSFTAVVDCGSTSGKDASDILAEYLWSHGIGKIDLLILTHFHKDHAGGAAELIARGLISAVAFPDPSIDGGKLSSDILEAAKSRGSRIIQVTENLSVSSEGVMLSLFAPVGSSDSNERGLSVLCSAGDFDVLITGDLSAEMEDRLLTSVDLPDIEVYIAGHHGSKHSTSEALLETLRPEIAVISVGYNSYGHPSKETLDRLYSRGIMTYRTDIIGSVTVKAS